LETQPSSIRKIIYVQSGSYLFKDKNNRAGGREFFYKRKLPIYQINDEYVALVEQYLSRLGKYTSVVWLGPWIEPFIKLDGLYRLDCDAADLKLKKNLRVNLTNLDGQIKSISGKTSSVEYISSIDALGFDIGKDYYDCASLYWRDSDHWSEDGELRFGSRLRNIF